MFGDIKLNLELYETTINPPKETFEAQVVVLPQPYKKTIFPALTVDVLTLWKETQKIISSGRYRVEFLLSQVAYGKPTLLIYEEEANEPTGKHDDL